VVELKKIIPKWTKF